MSSLNSEKALAGASWMMLANIASVLLKFVTIPILARMLSPEDFGVVALAMSVVIFLSYIGGKGGLSAALIASKTATSVGWNSALWMNFFIGSLLATGMFVFASPIAHLLGSDNAVEFIAVLAFLIPIQFAVDILNAKYIVSLQFKKEASISSFADVFSGIVALVAAFQGAGAWALIIQHFLAQTIRLLAFSLTGEFWLRFTFSFAELRKLLTFSILSIFVEISNFLSFHAPVIIASKLIGINASGALSVQGRLAALPGDIVLQGIAKVLFPMFSSNKLSQEGMQSGLLWSVWINSILLVPILFGLSAIAEQVTAVMLGEQYLSYGFVLAGLALSRGIMVPCSSFNPYLKASGKIKQLLWLFIFRAVLVLTTGITLSSYYGLKGLVISLVLSSVLSFLLYVPVTYSLSNIKLKKGCLSFLPAMMAGTAMYAVIHVFLSAMTLPLMVELVSAISLGAVVYVSVLLLFYKELRKIRTIKQFKKFLSKSPN